MPSIFFSIDLRTMILFNITIFLLKGIFSILIYQIRRHAFLQWLAYGCFAFAFGWLLFLERFIYGVNWITLPLANIFILLLPIALTFAVLALLKIRPPLLYCLSTLILLILTFLFLITVMQDPWLPGIYTSALNSICYLVPAILLIKLAHPKKVIIWAIITLNFAISLALMVRALILGVGWMFPSFIGNDLRTELLSGVLFFNAVCIDAQVLCFPILEFIDAEDHLAIANRQLEELSKKDELTGLFNRRALKERLDGEVITSRNANVPLSVILLDVDHFKQINDRFGHPAGDEVLTQTAQLIQQSVRPDDMVVRYGGEEFIVVLPNTSCEAALSIAERLRVLISEYHFDHLDYQLPHQVTASFGVTELNSEFATASDFLSRVDEALYQAKTQGRNQVCYL